MSAIFRFIQVSGTQFGALVVLAPSRYVGDTTTIYQLDSQDNYIQPYYASVAKYETDDGKEVYAAVFPSLPPGNYTVYKPGTTWESKKVTVFPGSIAQVVYN